MKACLLIHGYLGTPFELEPLVSPLESLGLAAHLVTLPGHNSSLAEFRRATFADWAAHAEAEYDSLAAEYEDVIVIGFSLGGALALHLAEERKPCAVVTLAAPVFPARAWPAQAAGWLSIFLPGKKNLRPCTPESQRFAPWQGYKDVVHPPHFYGMYKGFTGIRKKLANVEAPIMIFHDKRDRVVNVKNAELIARELSSERIELELTNIKENVTAHHVLVTHQESSTYIISRLRSFIASVLGLPEAPLLDKTQGFAHS